jgi:hypothetical protein
MSDQEKTLPELYFQKTGRDIASDPSDYKSFIRTQTSRLYHKIYSARELKIREDSGEAIYQRLKENYRNFMRAENAENFAYPL